MDLTKLDKKENVLLYQKVMAGQVNYYSLSSKDQKRFLRMQEKVEEVKKRRVHAKKRMELRKKGLYGYRRII